MSYAQNTTVSPEKSKAEIESLLRKYGAKDFVTGTNDTEGRAMIGFRCEGRTLRFELPIPRQNEERFTHYRLGGGYRLAPRTQIAALKAWDQEVRRVWRALALVVKAKLEAVQSGITTFEHEFAMHIVMPDGKTVAQHVVPRIAEAYASGRVPPLLLPPAPEHR